MLMKAAESTPAIWRVIKQFVIVALVLFGLRDVAHQIGAYFGLSLPVDDNLMIVGGAIVVVFFSMRRERRQLLRGLS